MHAYSNVWVHAWTAVCTCAACMHVGLHACMQACGAIIFACVYVCTVNVESFLSSSFRKRREALDILRSVALFLMTSTTVSFTAAEERALLSCSISSAGIRSPASQAFTYSCVVASYVNLRLSRGRTAYRNRKEGFN